MKQPFIEAASLFGLCFAVVLTPTAMLGDVIYDNVEATEDLDIGSFSFTSTTGGYQYQVADDFVLPGESQWIVDGARWGGMLASRFESHVTIGETFDFDLLILPDNAGRPAGTPKDIIPGTAVAHRQAQATGTDTGIFEFAADFEVSFDPIKLDGGTPYWLVVAARDDFTFLEANESGLGWLWGGISGTGNAWQGGADFKDEWFLQSRQQDFTLFGEAVSAGQSGDFNGDDNVNGVDFLAWQREPSLGELSDWQANFGTTAPFAVASRSVPEPATLLLLAMAVPMLHSRCRRRGVK